MHVVLRGPGPSYEHQEWLRQCGEGGSRHLGAPTRLQDAMGSAIDSWATFISQASPTNVKPSGRLLHPRPPSPSDCLWCETNGDHFTEECRSMQRSKEQHRANRA